MNLFHIRYFVKLAEVGHYTKAAQELHITQPSLSHAISQLENELGVPNARRNPTLITPSPLASLCMESTPPSSVEIVCFAHARNSSPNLVSVVFLP